jgi:hypothetical protein
MAKTVYCKLCERNVGAKRDYRWELLFLLTGIASLHPWLIIFPFAYVIFFLFDNGSLCSICGGEEITERNVEKNGAILKEKIDEDDPNW